MTFALLVNFELKIHVSHHTSTCVELTLNANCYEPCTLHLHPCETFLFSYFTDIIIYTVSWRLIFFE